jgi:hypothetical protein
MIEAISLPKSLVSYAWNGVSPLPVGDDQFGITRPAPAHIL